MWNKNTLEAALSRQISDGEFKKISIDSRTINSGDVFIAIKGINFDGNNFAATAIKNGASLSIVSSITEDLPTNQLLLVEDTYQDGLIKLATYRRNNHDAIYIGITGSVGKTTTKDMLKHILGSDAYATDGNLNNHYGLPLSLANMNNSKFGVFELGMSAPGEIAFLSSILRPNIAMMTNIAPAHLEKFTSLDGIAAAKAEIIDGLTSDGFLIVNFDSGSLDVILKIAGDRRIIGYSVQGHLGAQVSLIKSEIILINSLLFTVIYAKYKTLDGDSLEIDYKINGIGEDLIINSLGVLSVLLISNLDIAIIKRLESFEIADGRGKIHHVVLQDIYLIDESYNSNPASLAAAFRRMYLYSKFTHYKRKVAILGDMLELGPGELDLHRNLINNIENNEINAVICIGERMRALYDILDSQVKVTHFKTSDDAASEIDKFLQTSDLVMIKGSNGMKMSTICNAIKNIK
jgi:UDP-N-acetylmuramoyl-tripeptide--D-alanyl-D-alanine ligase